VNREAELRPPSRVACSDLLGGTVTTLSLGMLNMRIDNQSVVNLEYLRIYSWIEGKEVLLREVEALSNARECIAGLYGVISDICCAALRCICRNRMRFPGFGGGYSVRTAFGGATNCEHSYTKRDGKYKTHVLPPNVQN